MAKVDGVLSVHACVVCPDGKSQPDGEGLLCVCVCVCVSVCVYVCVCVFIQSHFSTLLLVQSFVHDRDLKVGLDRGHDLTCFVGAQPKLHQYGVLHYLMSCVGHYFV